MQCFRRNSFLSKLPSRNTTWHSLGVQTSTKKDEELWRRLIGESTRVDSSVKQYVSSNQIDWSHWERRISNRQILNSLKSFYEEQVKEIENIKAENHLNVVLGQKEGWGLFHNAMKQTEKAVEKSESLVADGARGLWVSYHNPHLTKIEDHEWLDSDEHFQAVLERQYLYNPTASVAEECLPKWKSVIEEGWKHKMETFNARSDTPVLYQYMDQLPSWEFYDIHRRTFLEHMTYYLVRTGGDYRYFPECPPWKWCHHMEELRYSYLLRLQKDRAEQQIANLSRETALSMVPLNSDSDGETHYFNLFQKELRTYENMVAIMMSKFQFLSHPYIPLPSQSALQQVKETYGSKGTVYSVGDDAACLFFLPENPELPTPSTAINTIKNFAKERGIEFEPGYSLALDIWSDIVETRGSVWLKAPTETASDTFIRKLPLDDPSYPIYKSYCAELKMRFANAQEIKSTEVASKLAEVEKANKLQMRVYDLYKKAFDTDERPRRDSQGEAEKAAIIELDESKSVLIEAIKGLKMDFISGSKQVKVDSEYKDTDHLQFHLHQLTEKL